MTAGKYYGFVDRKWVQCIPYARSPESEGIHSIVLWVSPELGCLLGSAHSKSPRRRALPA